MAEAVRRKPPPPLVHSFIPCRQVVTDARTGETMLIAVSSHIALANYPAHLRLSAFVEITGTHGRYEARLTLRDESDDEVWGWTAPGTFTQDDPVLPHRITLFDWNLAVPRPGRYQLVLQLNGEDVTQRPMWFGPAEFFRV